MVLFGFNIFGALLGFGSSVMSRAVDKPLVADGDFCAIFTTGLGWTGKANAVDQPLDADGDFLGISMGFFFGSSIDFFFGSSSSESLVVERELFTDDFEPFGEMFFCVFAVSSP